MGIPFYYASLLKSHRGIVSNVKPGAPVECDVLGVDFNCLIHRYLKDDAPVHSVVDALAYILEHVCRAKTIVLALDGLVPYAKIVQQRYRRMRAKEDGGGTFDRNQISPDTPYMRELETALRARFPFATVSGTTDPGEGEHKLIMEIQKMPEHARRSVCIYGLDADLILICLQHHGLSAPDSMFLLRESTEFNDPSLKGAEFAVLRVWSLLRELPIPIQQYMILSFMCFGNDFMPSLGMFSLREGGYERALEMYATARSPDLTTAGGRRAFLEHAAQKEREVLAKRVALRKRPEERTILGRRPDMVSRRYGLHVLDGVLNMAPVVDAYWKTFHWTLAYFGDSEPINWDWVYPYSDAPLVCDILRYPETDRIEAGALTFTTTNQLQFIMPQASLRVARRRVLFSDEIHSDTRNPWMKRHDWEMKPRISVPWHPTERLTSVARL
jgi:5'-3' exonuclease